MIDLKTLYEQTTMYSELVDEFDSNNYHFEIYHQPDTPIYIRVVFVWNFNPTTYKIHEISFSTDKGAYIP